MKLAFPRCQPWRTAIIGTSTVGTPGRCCESTVVRRSTRPERALGPEAFEEDVGQFWGILETRPCMSARAGLAQCLFELDTPCLGREGELNELIKRYGEDGSPLWLYLQTLAKFRQEGNTAQSRKRLKVALKSNQHIPPYLAGRRRSPKDLPEAYSPGDEDEAVWCAPEIRSGWKSTPGAMDWLKQVSKPTK